MFSRLLPCLFFLLVWPLATAAAQDSKLAIPEIPSAASKASDFAPKGWRLEQEVRGDLNGDKMDDLVIVFREDYEPVDGANTDDSDVFDPMRRILVIAFQEAAGGTYKRVVQNHELIPERFGRNVDDYLAGADPIAINRGILRVQMLLFMSAGGWETGIRTFSFRYQDEDFALVGFDSSTVHRGSGETNDLSINYLTHGAEVTTGNIQNDDEKTERRKIPELPLVTLGGMGDGWEFEPEM